MSSSLSFFAIDFAEFFAPSTCVGSAIGFFDQHSNAWRHHLIRSPVGIGAWIFIVATGAVAYINPDQLMYRKVDPAIGNNEPAHYSA